MPRYGINLQKLFYARNASLPKEAVYSLGIQLLAIMEKIHAAGYVFNDLKLDNLLLDSGMELNEELMTTQEDIF